MIENWSTKLKIENLFIDFFNEIQWSPQKLIFKVLDFLGVESHEKYLEPSLIDLVNPTQSLAVPEKVSKMLSQILKDEILAFDELKSKYYLEN